MDTDIPPWRVARVFDLFLRLEAARQHSIAGDHGLSLASVAAIVRMHGSQVGAHSHGGQTTVQFIIDGRVCRLRARCPTIHIHTPLHSGASAVIVRIEIEGTRAGFYEYRVSYDSDELYTDAGLASIEDCLVGAIEGMPPDALGAEVWYRAVVSGTYPLPVIAGNLEQVAQHAANTAEAIHELSGGR